MYEQNTQNQTMETLKIRKEGSVGALIGSIIVILIILAGGVYFMDSLRNRMIEESEMPAEENATTSEATINAELDAIDLEELDAELAEIEAEIDAAIEE
jgi:uncharacterized protein HemX